MAPANMARAAGFAAVALGAYALLATDGREKAAVPPAAPPPAVAPAPSLALPAATPTPTPSAQGLVLYGVSGGGTDGMAAIIGTAPDRQRLVPVGRDYRPGLTVTEVGLNHAVLGRGPEAVRLELRRFAAATATGETMPAANAAPRTTTASSGGGGRIEPAALRSGLVAVKSNGRVAGFAIRPGANLVQLQRAGLQAGDVIVSVNGSQFDEERMSELAWEVANSAKTELVFVRNGRRIKAVL